MDPTSGLDSPIATSRAADVAPLVGDGDGELEAALERALTSHNMSATGVTEERSLSVKVCDDAGLVAGLTGWTWGDCAGISMVWVREDSRRAGWGGRVLDAAEDEASRRGCNRMFVSSFTFQAPHFYASHGYREVARIEGLLAEDAADVWFIKRLP